MPVVNIGLQITRNRVAGLTQNPVNSVGFGTTSAAEAATDTRLGASAGTSYWKSGVDVTITDDGTATTPNAAEADPWAQWEATWSTAEANDVLYELGTGVDIGSHAAQDDTNLYTRKRIGGAGGIGKTSDIELIGRVKVTF